MSFDIDSNGIVNVTAKDKATGKDQSIEIKNSGGLSEKEIEDMIKKAEEMKDEDAKKRVFYFLIIFLFLSLGIN